MTDKQFSSLRTTVIGAAFFIGGAILSLAGENFAALIMVVGCILLIKDFAVSLWTKDAADSIAEEKEERKYDAH